MAAPAGSGPPEPIDVLPTQQGYDQWAELYDHEDNPLIALEERFMPPLLGDVRGLDVLDVGCGTGRKTLALAAAGARVTGLDFSEQMLARARGKSGAAGVTFISHDLHQPFPVPSAAFDRIVCCLVLEHIQDLSGLFAEFRRACRRDGAVVISTMHPAMMLRGISARFRHPQTGRDTRPQSLPHTISDFVMAAVLAGLRADYLSEHAVDAALMARSPRAEKYKDWPMLFLMRLRP